MPESVPIRFRGREIEQVAIVGLVRAVDELKKGINYRRKASIHNFFTNVIDSTFGEAALAKHLNVYWCVGESGAIDLPPGYQVRHTSHDAGRLIVYREDDLILPFVLVTGLCPNYEIRGWLWGSKAKRAEFWQPTMNVPAFFVPQDGLRPISTLPTPAELPALLEERRRRYAEHIASKQHAG